MSPSVKITYTLHPSPVNSSPSSSILYSAIAGVRAHLPLRNLHWKSSSRTSLRTIQEIDVELVELGEVSSARGMAESVLDSPLVNMCFVVCEDAEIYKSQTRNFVRDWLSLLAARRAPHTALIVLVNPPSVVEKTGKSVWGKDKGVLGKLKADFNVGKVDRCIQLNLPPPETKDPAAWPELLNKIKESFVSAFDSAILEREEEVKRGEAQRLMVGWNFCTWFLLKESLAQSFELVNLPEDSLIVYEELEASFLQVVKEQNLSWIGKLGANGPNDDSLPILDTTVKPYREMLRNSAISIFDFRIYLFARQGILLGKLGRVTEVAKRGQWFVASLAKRLRENESDLAEYFIESWTYTACMDIVSKCDRWSYTDRSNGNYSGLTTYESARLELLDIARIQVERLGVSLGHLPNAYPFQPPSTLLPFQQSSILFDEASVSSSVPPSPTVPRRQRISNNLLSESISDHAKFLELYKDLTDKAQKAHVKFGKIGSSIRLKADLSALALISKEWNNAYSSSRALAMDCVEQRIWEPVSKFAMETAFKAHKHLNNVKDLDWAELGVAYLEVCATNPSKGEELDTVIEGLKALDVGLDVKDHRAFEVIMMQDECLFEDDQTSITVKVSNRLGSTVLIDSISLYFVNPSGEGVFYYSKNIDLQPGSNSVKLLCSTSTQGIYILRVATITLGRISFLYNTTDQITRLTVRRDDDGPQVKMRMPYDMRLDDDSKIVFEIKGGRFDIKSAFLRLQSLNGDISYVLSEAKIYNRTLQLNEQGSIVIGDISLGQAMEVYVPYMSSSTAELAQAHIILQYETEKGSRAWIDTQCVKMGLPLTVNVQDFFRPQCLLSHFTIAADANDSLKIFSVDLSVLNESSYEVEACGKTTHSVVVTPQQSLSCLFRIRKKITEKDSTPSLRLSIKYCKVEEEIRSSVVEALRTVPPSARAEVEHIIRQVLADRSRWKAYLVGEPLGDTLRPYLDRIPEVAKEFCAGLNNRSNSAKWRTLDIPVDVPQRRLLTTIRITALSTDEKLVYQGRPLAMKLLISTSSEWMGVPIPLSVEEENQKLMFDVQANPDDWVLLGKKRGSFISDSENDEEQHIVLLPIRAGVIFLPHVLVHPIELGPLPGQPISQYQTQTCGQGILYESYVENAGQTINVLPAKKEVTTIVPVPLPSGIAHEADWDE
ncbi:uncharacterized protein L203_106203 [Cryptococcus depauperatus CBS 7841]|uniref:Trafficking protein particle complex subunit 10 n=1 Tax=Cryptococcus depauperatus CBS 7841 TaxID=1295531 RepID=A0AAJ8M486_9TREE